jgi:hypothetical protein
MNAFDFSGSSKLIAQLKESQRNSNAITRSIEKKRAVGIDPLKIWGISHKADALLLNNKNFKSVARPPKSK